jgi:Flp pilus assembly pilin Flp
MTTLFTRFYAEDHGQDLIEYALLAAFVALATVVGITTLGSGLNDWYTNISGPVKALKATF